MGSRVRSELSSGWVDVVEFEVGDGSLPFLVPEPRRHLGNTHHFDAMVRKAQSEE
jgi:hypothetical protein